MIGKWEQAPYNRILDLEKQKLFQPWWEVQILQQRFLPMQSLPALGLEMPVTQERIPDRLISAEMLSSHFFAKIKGSFTTKKF